MLAWEEVVGTFEGLGRPDDGGMRIRGHGQKIVDHQKIVETRLEGGNELWCQHMHQATKGTTGEERRKRTRHTEQILQTSDQQKTL